MVADPIKAGLTKSRPEEGRTDQIGGLRLGARAGRPPLGSVRSGEAEAPPIRTHYRTASTPTVQTQSRNIRTQRRGPRQRRSRGQVYSAELQVTLFITSPLQVAAWRVAELPRVNRVEGPSRSETDCWVL